MKTLNVIFMTLLVLSFTYFISQFYRTSLGILSNEMSTEFNLFFASSIESSAPIVENSIQILGRLGYSTIP